MDQSTKPSQSNMMHKRIRTSNAKNGKLPNPVILGVTSVVIIIVIIGVKRYVEDSRGILKFTNVMKPKAQVPPVKIPQETAKIQLGYPQVQTMYSKNVKIDPIPQENKKTTPVSTFATSTTLASTTVNKAPVRTTQPRSNISTKPPAAQRNSNATQVSRNVTKKNPMSASPYMKAANASKDCMIRLLESKGARKNLWNFLETIFKSCTRPFESLNLKHSRLGYTYALADYKGFVNFTNPTAYVDKCTQVTIGIGGEMDAENELIKILPKCKFYGADPVVPKGKMFEKVGKYIPVAVSDQDNTTEKLSVITTREKDTSYTSKDTPVVSLPTFLKMAGINSVIDFLFLDPEGSEYKILPYFSITNTTSEQNITVCQLSMELHARSQGDLERSLVGFLKHSQLVPLWGYRFRGILYRCYFISYHPECIERFFAN